jgi:hypothetical protein
VAQRRSALRLKAAESSAFAKASATAEASADKVAGKWPGRIIPSGLAGAIQ